MGFRDPTRASPAAGRGGTFCAVLFLLATAETVQCVSHSLTYSYTAFSEEPVSSPGLHKFTAMGLLDGRMIDYFDSDTNEKVPKQEWMKNQDDDKYWVKGTERRRSKMKWCDDNIGILMERMRQNHSDVHTLQGLLGCEAGNGDGQYTFAKGLYMFNYDGQRFLEFDSDHGVWSTSNTAAIATITKWNEDPKLKEDTNNYLEIQCLRWMERFLRKEREELAKNPPPEPEVFLFATKSVQASKVHLTCFATGFYHRDVELEMRRGGELIQEVHGLTRSGVRPNHDNTYQQRDSVEVLSSDTSEYTCKVSHSSFKAPIRKVWDHKLPGGFPKAATFGALAALLFIVAVIATLLLILHKNNKLGCSGSRSYTGSHESKTPAVSRPSVSYAYCQPVKETAL